tara:strand:+ start:258 stop:896 length:639 start_codon:yes stop_codon:yes gene_type:complete
MKIKSFTFNNFQENTYVLYDETKECIIIDPGCYSQEEKIILSEFIINNKLNPVKLINTHCHIDHVLGNQYAIKKWSLDLYLHKDSIPLLKQTKNISEVYGFYDFEESPEPKHYLEHKQIIKFGLQEINVLHTPGHAPGHICLYNKTSNLLIAGDLIFKGSVGRTDLPGGNYETLINSIKTEIILLPENTKIYSGHGPSTILGNEKKNNPYMQ